MNALQNKVLHCMGKEFARAFSGGSEKKPINVEIKSIQDRVTLISLRHACLASGLLGDEQKSRPINWQSLGEMVQAKWGRSMDRFLAEAASKGASLELADAAVGHFRGAVIGWPAKNHTRVNSGAFGICLDLNLTMGILSRCAGDIFLAARPADYGWEALFNGVFECDEKIGEAPALNEKPWSAYKWKVPPERRASHSRYSIRGGMHC